MRQRNQGFTLIELVVSLVIMGILSTVFVTAAKQSQGVWLRANTERQHEANRMVIKALQQLARESATGELPAPYTGSGLHSAPYDPADTDAREAFLGQGLSNNLINTDGSPVANRRVYQKVSGLTRDVPVAGLTGDTVTLTYELGVVYATACPSNRTNCVNGGVPGASDKLTAANVDSWEPKGDDLRPVWVNTFPFQQNLFHETMRRVNTFINKEKEFYQQAVLNGGAGAADNYHVRPTDPMAPNMEGMNPISNGGCHRGWYQLNAANVNILELLGLNKAEYGVTAWDVAGNQIEYCNDYDPANTGADTAPHSAAVRFKRDTSNPAGASDYVVLSY